MFVLDNRMHKHPFFFPLHLREPTEIKKLKAFMLVEIFVNLNLILKNVEIFISHSSEIYITEFQDLGTNILAFT
jgi:hypothetical protein